MEKLKVGTKVQIKSNLSPNEPYGHGSISPLMVRYNGLETEVSEVHCNWYALKGAAGCYQPEMFDVIKESVTMEKKSFAIPEGCKVLNVSEESGRLVIEFEEVKKFEPKKGDVCAIHIPYYNRSVVFFYTEKRGNEAAIGMNTDGKYSTDKIGLFDEDMDKTRPATPAETAQLFTALEKEGLRWNAETMEVERLRWKPRHGERYYCLSTDVDMRNDSNEHDEARFKVGDCFKTADDRLAAIEKVKALLLSL